MMIDNRYVILFAPPVLAILLCFGALLVVPVHAQHKGTQPEFLSFIDQLSLFTMEEHTDTPARGIKDVFRHEWTLVPAITPALHDIPEKPPVRVTMIVRSDRGDFCIINGRKMRSGEESGSFKVSSIGRDHVTITYKNGTRETHHVKAY